MSERCLIVGAGQAGLRVALNLRERGYAGVITLMGEEQRLPYERPPLSKDGLLRGIDAETGRLTSAEQLRQAAVELLSGERATALDIARRSVLCASGLRLAFERLVVATGARARRLSIPGADAVQVHYLRSAEDALRLRPRLQPGARVVLIGGGFIGLEVAASAAQLGCLVTILEVESRLLARAFSPELSAHVRQLHEHAGVTFRLGATVLSLIQDDQTIRVLTTEEPLSADVVIAGVGAEPDCEWLSDSTVPVQNGVLVDEYCRTSVAGVYAVGDVANGLNLFNGRRVRVESWHNAEVQATVVADAICDVEAPQDCVPWFWTDQYATNIQMLGMPAAGAERILRGIPAAGAFVEFSLEAGQLTGATLVNQGRLRRVIETAVKARAQPHRGDLANSDRELRAVLQAATPRAPLVDIPAGSGIRS